MKMLIIAHRGGKALGPENTIATMNRSLVVGADGIEMDVHCCFGKDPVVIHDETIDRTTNGSGEVAKMSIESIQQYEVEGGEKVPSLVQVLEEMRQKKPTLFIELKHPDAAMPTAKIVDHFIRERGYPYNQIIIISFMHQLLARIHAKYPKLITGASLQHVSDTLAAPAAHSGSQYILAPIDELTEAFVKDARSHSLRVVTWGCDDPNTGKKAIALGVDGIITADPSLFVD